MKNEIKDEKIKRIKTYIGGFDENMQGGVPEGHIVLVCGSSGTMKSSVTFNMLYNEVLNGKTGIYITLEQSARSLLNQMENMGFDMSKINMKILSEISKLNETTKKAKSSKTGNLVISDLGAIRKKLVNTKFGPSGDWLNAIKNIIKKIKSDSGCNMLILDSLSALYVLSSFENPRTKIFHIFEFLRDLGITSFLISEMPLDQSKYSEYKVEDFLSDGIIYLQLTKRVRKVNREISVVKMRATECNNDVFSLEYKDKKFYAAYGGKTPLV